MPIKMKYALSVLAASAFLPFGAAAQVYEAPNKLRVVPLKGGTFEVIEARGEGARGMWCAAASYVLDRLPGASVDRLYVQTPRGPSVTQQGSKGVVFTATERTLDVAPVQALSVGVRRAGQGLPVLHAVQFCRDNFIEPEDILFRKRGGF